MSLHDKDEVCVQATTIIKSFLHYFAFVILPHAAASQLVSLDSEESHHKRWGRAHLINSPWPSPRTTVDNDFPTFLLHCCRCFWCYDLVEGQQWKGSVQSFLLWMSRLLSEQYWSWGRRLSCCCWTCIFIRNKKLINCWKLNDNFMTRSRRDREFPLSWKMYRKVLSHKSLRARKYKVVECVMAIKMRDLWRWKLSAPERIPAVCRRRACELASYCH